MKTERINIRVTVKEKKDLETQALKNNKTISEYMLDCCKKKKNVSVSKLDYIREAVNLQEALNHIEENYGDDDYLQEIVDKLWEL